MKIANKNGLKIPAFSTFRNPQVWEKFVQNKLAPFEKNISQYLKFWYIESRENSHAYPSQGMLTTPFDFLPVVKKAMVDPESMVYMLRVRQYFLELFNHPERIAMLKTVQKQTFVAPQ